MAKEQQNPVHVPHAASPKIQQKQNIYEAEYLGSGTFKVVKPKRQNRKRRDTART